MNRRSFLTYSGAFGASLSLAPLLSFYPYTPQDSFRRLLPRKIDFPPIEYPEGKRVPMGWPVFPVHAAKEPSTILHFSKKSLKGPLFLRLTAAIDFREEKRLTLYLGKSNQQIGEWVMTFAHPYQPFEFEIPEEHTQALRKEGIKLVLSQGAGEAWFYGKDKNTPEGLQPHLLEGHSPGDLEGFFDNFYSMNSFSPFGWMGGSVQDALYSWHQLGEARASETLKKHLENYLDDEIGIMFENPNTFPLDGQFNSIEDFLPFTAIIDLYPTHKAIDQALSFILERRDENGIIGGNQVTTEGCYTLAYPLMATGLKKGDDSLKQIALDQLEVRMNLLTDDKAIYQRSSLEGQQGYRNWGRGAAWYLLGIIKTAWLVRGGDLAQEMENRGLRESFVHLCEEMATHQDGQGMWRGYVDQEQLAVDTSATGGIAAAMVWGVNMGWLDSHFLDIGSRAADGLKVYLSPDGFLRGVSQINRGGEELQQSPYRVISQFGMGLMGQLLAALAYSEGG
ncbi:glycoside hydrolase family 88 protein [Pleomorphovibrio marinus]|uniref:glycoside hydrolase family 88 protein n=1 Tax=Pleomorphovibrio marinus TaxID=2164132 RepID=UPI000E0C803E|nr:glycoside hydrolase family 88 protein [Pleomorphovibrio marinus]